MNKLRSILLVLASVSCLSFVSAVEAPSFGKRDRPIVITHEQGEKINAIFATVRDGRVELSYLPEDHFRRYDKETVFSAPPGEYIIVAGDARLIKVIEEGKPRPDPNPDPGPNPDPDPQPDPDPEPGPETYKVEYAIWIMETDDLAKHADQRAVSLLISNNNFLKDRDIMRRNYDPDQKEAKPFLSKVDGPTLILFESDERWIALPAPKTSLELEKIIQTYAIR